MKDVKHEELVKSGAHLGHLKRKWNPNMKPYIFMEKQGVHVIDLNKTMKMMETAANALKELVARGKKVLFVGTKKQAKEFVEEEAERLNMPYVTDRWYGGMLTNFATIRRSVKKMKRFDKMTKDGTFENITKKERLKIMREKAKLEKSLGGIADMNRLPAALFIVDTIHEHIAVREAKKLNITTFALVDTNADPTDVDFPIPTNDDSTKTIELMMEYFSDAVEEGLQKRQKEKAELRKKQKEKRKKAEKKKAAEKKKEEEKAGKKSKKEKKKSKGKAKKVASSKDKKSEKKKDTSKKKQAKESKEKKKKESKKEAKSSKKSDSKKKKSTKSKKQTSSSKKKSGKKSKSKSKKKGSGSKSSGKSKKKSSKKKKKESSKSS